MPPEQIEDDSAEAVLNREWAASTSVGPGVTNQFTALEPVTTDPEVEVDPEFQALIPASSDQEQADLESSLKSEGCRDSLVAWKGLLLDGHTRLAICRKHGISYRVVHREFANRNAAKEWIIRNQLGRRNLTPYQRAELVAHLEPMIAARARENLRTSEGGAMPRPRQRSGNPVPIDTKREMAKLAGMSHDTWLKAKHVMQHGQPDLKEQLRDGDLTVNSAWHRLKQSDREQKLEQRRALNRELAASATDPLAVGAKFATILLDPPWSFGENEKAGDIRGWGPPYARMPLEEIAKLPVGQLADEDCHLYLWVTNRSMPLAFGLIREWGFGYVTCLTWCKPSIKLGTYFQNSTEHVLFALTTGLDVVPLASRRPGGEKPAGSRAVLPVAFTEIGTRVHVQNCEALAGGDAEVIDRFAQHQQIPGSLGPGIVFHHVLYPEVGRDPGLPSARDGSRRDVQRNDSVCHRGELAGKPSGPAADLESPAVAAAGEQLELAHVLGLLERGALQFPRIAARPQVFEKGPRLLPSLLAPGDGLHFDLVSHGLLRVAAADRTRQDGGSPRPT